MFDLRAAAPEPKLTPPQLAKIQHSIDTWAKIDAAKAKFATTANILAIPKPRKPRDANLSSDARRSMIHADQIEATNEMLLNTFEFFTQPANLATIWNKTGQSSGPNRKAINRLRVEGKIKRLRNKLQHKNYSYYILSALPFNSNEFDEVSL